VASEDPALIAAGAMSPLVFLPGSTDTSPAPSWADSARKLQAVLERQQFGGPYAGCGMSVAPSWRTMYYVHTAPLIGFASVVEYGLLYLARATNLRSQLVLGRHSSPGWTSDWACGGERSLTCYFNLSSCCGRLTYADQSPVELSRRRNPISIGLPGFNKFGSLWVSAHLAQFFFSRFTPSTRAAVDARRASIFPRSDVGSERARCIGVHIRGGDSCHAGRFCPINLTATFFASAARMRERYGLQRVVLATDSERAASLCATGVMGFDCRTLSINRAKFESPTFIEQRVSRHATGDLSGSTVALDTLADIDMLADCDALVLVLRSAVSRLTYALATARKGRPVPVISLHNPLSPAYAKKKMKVKRAP
jgi:hypothetical protein